MVAVLKCVLIHSQNDKKFLVMKMFTTKREYYMMQNFGMPFFWLKKLAILPIVFLAIKRGREECVVSTIVLENILT